MFELFNAWIQNITFYFIIVTLILQMSPDKSYRKYIQFITGLILILLLMEPIMNFTEFTVSFESYQNELKRFEEEIHELETVEVE